MSRGTAVGAGSGFDRSETIGLWDTVHDGWRGQLRIGVDPSYVQAADAVTRRTWIDPGATPHRVDTHIDFGGDNRDQYFQLLAHTREDGLLGGVTSVGRQGLAGRGPDVAEPVHDLAGRFVALVPPHRAGRIWPFSGTTRRSSAAAGKAFRAVFGGGDGVIYAIQPDGALQWYYHDGRNQGTFNWQGPKQVGTGWQVVRQVFAGDGGVIYGITSDGKLVWYRHLGRRDGTLPLAGAVPGRHRLEQLHRRRRGAGRLPLWHSAATARCSGIATTVTTRAIRSGPAAFR